MNGDVEVFRHLPFADGCATIVPACAPWSRHGTGQPRFALHLRICRVVLFRAGQPAQQASFFGAALTMAWMTAKLGPMCLERLQPSPGIDAIRFAHLLRLRLEARGLLPTWR